MWRYDDDHARFRHGQWRRIFDDQLKSSPLTIQGADPIFSLPLGEQLFSYEHWLSKEEVWQRFRTHSQIAVLEGEELEVSLVF